MHSFEGDKIEWIKELEERKERLDCRIADLERSITNIDWKVSVLQKFKEKIDEKILRVNHPQLIVERTDMEMKRLAKLKGEKREERAQLILDREFCETLVTYLRSQPEFLKW